MLLAVLLPLLAGALLPLLKIKDRKKQNLYVFSALCVQAVLTTCLLFSDSAELPLFTMTDQLRLFLRMDGVSRLFLAIAAYGFLAVGVYSFRYMEHAGEETRFYAFYLLALGVLTGLDLAGNLITMYLFFELLTILSVPLVLHDRTQEAVRAGLKYLFYSVAGAFLALLCIFFLSRYADTSEFRAGGVLEPARIAGHESLLRIVCFLGVVGFGAKAGLYPLHGWLPTAHPVAPAPASAVLSGIIAKAGVLAVIRTVYYVAGPALFRGTWVQYAWLSLALLTVFMGSMMAFREQAFKKRLAYSSVSQLSYILTGLFLLTPQGVLGGLLHVLFHAVIKICLFMVAGSFIFHTGKHEVEDYRAIGKAMPITLWGFTLAALSLIGIPPAAGFVSKWYLALGALDSGLPVFAWLAPVVLLVSALLTAGYLLPITIAGFFPGKNARLPQRNPEGGLVMWGPILCFGVLSILLGLLSGLLVPALSELAQSLF